MNLLPEKKFNKLSEEEREEYLNDIAEEIYHHQAEIDILLSYIYEKDGILGSEVTEYINERGGV